MFGGKAWPLAIFKPHAFERFSTPVVNFPGSRLGAGFLLLNICANGAEYSRVFRSFRAQQPTNTWKAMLTNANKKGVPSFWQKWWNALTHNTKEDYECNHGSND
jgi:hypothetical protein